MSQSPGVPSPAENEADSLEQVAAAALRALAAPLEWTLIPQAATPDSPVWRSDAREYHYEVVRRHKRAVVSDPRPHPAEWRASVHFTGARNGLYFRCATPDDGKAICERFASTGDLSEIKRLAAIEYEFAWKHRKGRKVFEGDSATACMGVDALAWYSAREVRRFWLFRVYTAEFNGLACGWEDIAPRPYKTMAAAKAACEQHRATRQWDRA